jgi:hypothetical protein
LLSNIETGNANMSDRTGQQGRNRKERIDRKGAEQLRRTLAETDGQEFEIEIAILYGMIKSEQDSRGQKGRDVKKDRVDRTE